MTTVRHIILICSVLLFFLIKNYAEPNPLKTWHSVYVPLNVTIKDEPSVVSLRLRGVHFCSGAIISTRHIVTSAYCICYLKNDTLKDVRIILGASTSKGGGVKQLMVKTVACYPSRKKGMYVFQRDLVNLAIVEAAEPINFSSKHSLAKLPFFHNVSQSNDDCYFMGWNSDTEDFKNMNIPLQALRIDLESKYKCGIILSEIHSEKFVEKYLFCGKKKQFEALRFLDRNQAMKSYNWTDHGAPFYCNHMLLGISYLSYNRPNYPRSDNTIYTITSISPLYWFFENTIPEYKPINAYMKIRN